MSKGPSIQKVETILVDLPTIRPHVLSMATMHRQTIVIVRMHCSDGIVGIGEGTTIGGLSYGDESPESIKLAIDTYFAPILMPAIPPASARPWPRSAQVVHGNHFAKSAVETALLDAMGKRVGLPVSELLGGRHRDELPVAWTLASGDTARTSKKPSEMLSLRRHNIFKLKIGKRAVGHDVAHVAAIKRALGDRASVRVDVNQAWDEAERVRGLAMLEAAGVDLVEQPIAKANRRRAGPAGAARHQSDHGGRGPAWPGRRAFDLARHAAADVFARQDRAVRRSPRLRSRWPPSLMLPASAFMAARCSKPASARSPRPISSRPSPQLAWGTELFGPLLLTEEILRNAARLRRFRPEGADGTRPWCRADPNRIEPLPPRPRRTYAPLLPRDKMGS